MIGYVNLDFRVDRISIWSHSKTVEGVFVANGYQEAFSRDVANEDLGGAIIRGLGRTEVGIPSLGKGDMDRALRRLVRLSGRDSFKQYAQDIASIGVDRDEGGVVTLMPTRADRRRASFDFLSDLFIVLPSPVVGSDLGRMARIAEARCI